MASDRGGASPYRDEVLAMGAEFFVVILSNEEQAYPDPDVRRHIEQSLGVPDLFYPDRRVEALCRGAGIPVLLLAPRFQEYATKHKTYYLHGFGVNLGSGHWNEKGHRLAGEMIAEWLCPQLASLLLQENQP